MAIDQTVREFLNERRFATLATIGEEQAPQLTVMWYLLDGDDIIMNTAHGRVKEQNLLRDARAAVMVEDGLRYVSMNGSVAIDTDSTRGQQSARQLATRYDGEAAANLIMDEVFSKQMRVTLVFTPDRIDLHGFPE